MDFKKSTIYQIYIKSFNDSNSDGIGDINGITQKLDYLQNLGISYIWVTPFFKSPQNDNGYDVSNYYEIEPMFGTMQDVEKLIKEAEKRNIGLMFDMVFNHTSTEHEWFQKALKGDKKYQDFYFFKDNVDGNPPTNWQSKFGGSAWEYIEYLDKWYLHLFDKTQADLNWDNKEVREELKKVILFWKNKGIKGFRFDVINLVSKPSIFENDNIGDGRRFYTDGPHIHEYIKELVKDTEISDMVTVGEMSSTSIDNCVRYSNPKEKELSMTFSFHHLKIDYKNGQKWELMKPDMKALYNLFYDWQIKIQEKGGYNALFWTNHDQPRITSRLGNPDKYFYETATVFLTFISMLRGTPYIYQGEEIGMTNANFEDISMYVDVESQNYYKILLNQGKSEKEALHIISERSRDNSRTPMQWDSSVNAGFSDVVPWLNVNKNYIDINVEKDLSKNKSIIKYTKELIKLRKDMEIISDGLVNFIETDTEYKVFAFTRTLENENILVVSNFSDEEINLDLGINGEYETLISNYTNDISLKKVRPYETYVLKIKS